MNNEATLTCTVVLGPRKCGTTTLYSLLSKISSIAIPGPIKEAHLFDEGPVVFHELMRSGKQNLNINTSAFIDVSTHYFSDRKLWDHIVHTPEVSHVAVILRDPVERFISHCLHQMRIKNEWHLTIDSITARYSEVVYDSLYSERLPSLYEVFGEENVILIDFEQLKNDPNSVVRLFCASVNVEFSEGVLPLSLHHKNSGLRPKFPAAYKLLRASAVIARRVLGDRLIEYFKQRVIGIWPVGDLNSARQKLEQQLFNHQLGERLAREREYVHKILRRKRANSNCL